jgi:protein involved in plasmid replication-relaxation
LTNSSASGDRVRVVRPRRRRRDLGCTLTDLDRRLLDLLCSLRVVRQDQLERLFPEVPERTLRHRMRRLHEHGLAGRSRPYRERGSAPNHHWPTRRASGIARGEPVPRGGDRGEPNPLFLAHTAAISELFVALETSGGPGLREFYREPREPFRDSSRERMLAPDALVVLVNDRDEPSLAFVEMDLGTMSHTRLRAKAEMYASYAASDAWRGAYEFLPALVFLTTSQPRALRFLHMLRGAIEQHKRRYDTVRLVAAAGPVVFAPGRVLAETCLTHLDGETQVTLIDVLNEARAPFDRERRAAEKRRETKERKRTEIREDPLLVRRLLLRESEGIASYLEQLDAVGRAAIQIAVASGQDDLSAQERTMFEVFGNELGDILIEPGFRRAPVPKEAAVRAVSDLVEHYRSAQLRRINELTARYGKGPALRQARAILDAGELLDARTMQELADQARANSEAKAEQEQQRAAYDQWREHAATERVRQTGLLKQLAHSRDEFYAEIDAEHLWVCSGCHETIYPKLDATGSNDPTKDYCHYCGRPPHGKRTGITGGVVLYR